MAKGRKSSRGVKGFKSKAQWRMFAARASKSPKWRKWFHEKAHATQGGPKLRYRRLPERKGGASSRTARRIR